MMGEIETEQAGGFADGVTLHQQAFRLIDDVVVYVADGCAACGLVDQIAKVSRSLPYPLQTVGAGRCGCSIPVSGADKPAALFLRTANPRVSAILVASESPTA